MVRDEDWIAGASDGELALRRDSLQRHIASNTEAVARFERSEDMTHVKRSLDRSRHEAALVDAELARRS